MLYEVITRSLAADLHASSTLGQLRGRTRRRSLDGMRCDVDGNLYVTRYGKGTRNNFV